MKNKILGLALVVIIAIAIGGAYKFPQVKQIVGAFPGTDVYSDMVFHEKVATKEFTQGGGVNATSTTDTTEVFQASDLLNYNVLDLTPNIGNTTYTLPATTTFPGIPKAGDMRQWVFRNATSTSGVTATIAAGTGIDLQEPDGQNIVIADTNFAWLTCYRKVNTDIACLVDESIPAD